jgi:hypothetical protein
MQVESIVWTNLWILICIDCISCARRFPLILTRRYSNRHQTYLDSLESWWVSFGQQWRLLIVFWEWKLSSLIDYDIQYSDRRDITYSGPRDTNNACALKKTLLLVKPVIKRTIRDPSANFTTGSDNRDRNRKIPAAKMICTFCEHNHSGACFLNRPLPDFL